jgi:hypothetical protein
MIGIGIFVGTLGFGLLTWLLFDLYVYMLPVWVGGLAGIAVAAAAHRQAVSED